MLDCGEGTLGQIERFYGEKAEEVIRKLKAIYISHLHADHHIGLFVKENMEMIPKSIIDLFIPIGLIGIIQMRQKLLHEKNNPIILLAPHEIQSWLIFYDSEIEIVMNEIEFVDNQTLVNNEKMTDNLTFLELNV